MTFLPLESLPSLRLSLSVGVKCLKSMDTAVLLSTRFNMMHYVSEFFPPPEATMKETGQFLRIFYGPVNSFFSV